MALPPLPPLNALRTFEVAARHRHLGRAAQELHVTHGAVSRQVKNLEAHLGVRVFTRVGRGLELTEAGRALYERTSRIFEELAVARRHLEGAQGVERRKWEKGHGLTCEKKSPEAGTLLDCPGSPTPRILVLGPHV